MAENVNGTPTHAHPVHGGATTGYRQASRTRCSWVPPRVRFNNKNSCWGKCSRPTLAPVPTLRDDSHGWVGGKSDWVCSSLDIFLDRCKPRYKNHSEHSVLQKCSTNGILVFRASFCKEPPWRHWNSGVGAVRLYFRKNRSLCEKQMVYIKQVILSTIKRRHGLRASRNGARSTSVELQGLSNVIGVQVLFDLYLVFTYVDH